MFEPIVSLIAAKPDQSIPAGIPLSDARLASFDAPEVRQWLSENDQRKVYVVAGEHVEEVAEPAMAISVSADEYDFVLDSTSH